VVINNVGLANSFQDPDGVPSNQVTTTITAVLGVKVVRPAQKPPVVQPVPVVQPSKLPYTGVTVPVTLFVQLGAGLVLIGGMLLAISRRRDRGRHLA
jgi:LPXTG-motif cell wall-anchored protein